MGSSIDATLRGIDPLLNSLTDVAIETGRIRSALLWEALVDLADRNPTAFQGKYTWGYAHEQKTVNFDAAFVRHLNETKWIPDGNGKLQRPELVFFESLDWTRNPFLLSRIHFKPPITSQLAEEAGFEPAMLDRLKSLGITSEAELIARLGLPETAISEGGSDGPTSLTRQPLLYLAARPSPTPPVADSTEYAAYCLAVPAVEPVPILMAAVRPKQTGMGAASARGYPEAQEEVAEVAHLESGVRVHSSPTWLYITPTMNQTLMVWRKRLVWLWRKEPSTLS